jgi:hypothetical protein
MEEAMKKQMLNAVVTLSIIVTLAVASFAGLSRPLKANVPFDFIVNGKTLPAGEYIVVPSNTPGLLLLRTWEAKQSAAVVTRAGAVEAKSKPSLVFRRYSNQYYLAKVVGDTSANELWQSKAEREAAKGGRDHLAKGGTAPEIITISAQLGQ